MKTVAVLGPKGTFSDMALTHYMKKKEFQWNAIYFPTIDEVFLAVGDHCQAGLIPLENTLDGYVQRSLDLLLETSVQIVDEVRIPIQFSLIGHVQQLSEIKRLYVQFKAAGQCRQFISSLKQVDIIPTHSNMASFYQIEHHPIPGEAAVIPAQQLMDAQASFQLKHITDSLNNLTRFVLIEPMDTNLVLDESTSFHHLCNNGHLRVPLYIMPQIDRAGILCEILSVFHQYHINLVSIISRPTKKNMGAYHFYLEIDCERSNEHAIFQAIKTIQQQHTVKLLGHYFIIL